MRYATVARKADKEMQARPPRRRQIRSEETKFKLLEATIECLASHGVSDTSTAMICERAGVTRGAYLHHFGSREALIIEALGHMLDTSFLVVERQIVELMRQERYEDVFDAIWQKGYDDWIFAGFELVLKSRTDPVIKEAWMAYSARFRVLRMSVFEHAFGPEAVEDSDLLHLLEGVLDLLRGIKLMQLVRRKEETEAQLNFWRELFTRELRRLAKAPGGGESNGLTPLGSGRRK